MSKKIKFLFSLLALVLAFSLGQGALRAAGGASLTLQPSSDTWQIGDVVSVAIKLDTGGSNTDGVDIFYLHYSQDVLEVQDANPQVEGLQISPGTLYPNTVLNKVDAAGGKISFSQVSAGGQYFKGSGTLATVSFKAINPGTANIYFDFTQGATTDCNVASAGQDILTLATGAKISLLGPEAGPTPPSEETPPDEEPAVAPTSTQAAEATGTLPGPAELDWSKTILFASAGLVVILLLVLWLRKRKKKDTI